MSSDDPFRTAEAVAHYAGNLRRNVPGIDVVHDLVELLLAEAVPAGGRVLVVGAGGGVEIAHLAGHHADWHFDGVDPSAQMLELARHTLGALAGRVALHEGYVFDAPAGPFDAATCLLTLHFIEREERLRTLQAIRERLRPGAPLVVLHHSIAGGEARHAWLQRNAAHGVRKGVDPEHAARGAEQIAQRLPILTPQQDEQLLRDAGFRDVELYYAALTFRGWIARA